MRGTGTAILIVTLACGGGNGDSGTPVTPQPVPIDTVFRMTAPPSVAAGGTVLAAATANVAGITVWTSEMPSVASVASDGRITGLKPGSATIRATFGSKTQDRTIEVFQAAFVSLSVGALHACARTSDRSIFCWGSGQALGRVDRLETCNPHGFQVTCTTTPQRNTVALEFAQTSTHGGECGLTDGSEAYCWADAAIGRPTAPEKVPGTIRFAAVETGGTPCGLDGAGSAYCWGYGLAGSHGSPPTTTCGTDACSPTPTPVLGGHVFKSISVGGAHACGLTVAGEAWCWGWNGEGQLGNGDFKPFKNGVYGGEERPVKVLSEVPFDAIEAGQFTTCALTAVGAAYCWGKNINGQLGIGSSSPRSTVPVAITGAPPFTSIALGYEHTCGLTAAGSAYCWGNNSGDNGGSLGDGTYLSRFTPASVAGNYSFVELRSRRFATCGRLAIGRVYCWGSNLYGQLGMGSTTVMNSNVPLGVGGVP